MEPNFGAFLLDITCFLDPGCEWLPIRPCDKVRGVIIAPGIFENREPSKPDFLHSCLIGQEIAAGGVDYELPVFIDGLNGDLRSGAGLVGGTSSFQSGGAYGFRSPEMPSCLHLAGYGGGSRRVGQRGWPVGGFDGDIGEHQGSVVLRLFGLERGGVGKSGPSRSARGADAAGFLLSLGAEGPELDKRQLETAGLGGGDGLVDVIAGLDKVVGV